MKPLFFSSRKRCECFTNKSQFLIEKGFTLIEMLIVVALIGILAAYAIPNYTGYTMKANRADAQDALTQTMFEMERFYTRNRTYTVNIGTVPGGLGMTGLPTPTMQSKDGFYTISAIACPGTIISRCVQLTATPVVGRRQNTDYTFTLDSRNRKTTLFPIAQGGGVASNDWRPPT